MCVLRATTKKRSSRQLFGEEKCTPDKILATPMIEHRDSEALFCVHQACLQPTHQNDASFGTCSSGTWDWDQHSKDSRFFLLHLWRLQ